MLPTPTDIGGDLAFLDGTDRSILNALITRFRHLLENTTRDDLDFPPGFAPDVLIAKIPDAGIPARNVTTPGRAECEIFYVKKADELNPHTSTPTLTAIKNPDNSAVKEWVYNIYPVKWYGLAGTSIYVEIRRERGGDWLCEKPTYRLKVKPNADTNPGSNQPASVFIGAVELAAGEDISVYLNWMAGGQKISAGKEAIAEYREDEQKWVYVEAECEST